MAMNALERGYITQETVIVPVPLHPAKMASRGYNQSERLAGGFAAFTGLTVTDGLIERTRNTGTQTALTADERIRNVLGAFRFTGGHSMGGRPVILIDDVLTTGSTVSACADALSSGGAGPVIVCVVAAPDAGRD